jgi:hypothetical protein
MSKGICDHLKEFNELFLKIKDSHYHSIDEINGTLECFFIEVLKLNVKDYDDFLEYFHFDKNNLNINTFEALLKKKKSLNIIKKDMPQEHNNLFCKIILIFNYIYETFYLEKLSKYDILIKSTITTLDEKYINSFDIDINNEFYYDYIILLRKILADIILIETNSLFNEKITNFIKRHNYIDKINKRINMLEEKNIELGLIKKTQDRLSDIKKDIIKLDKEILEELPKTKKIKIEKYYEITEKVQSVCDNYDKIQRNGSPRLKHILIFHDIMMRHFSDLSQKFTESETNKNENSGHSYY